MKKTIIPLLGSLLAMLLFSTGCNSVVVPDFTDEKNDSEENVNTVVQPTTVSNSSVSVNWEEYTDEEIEFWIEMPTGTTPVTNYLSRRKSVTFQNGDLNYKVSREQYPAIGTSASGAFDEFSYLDIVSSGTEEIGGRSFKKFISDSGYCDGPGCAVPFVAYSTQSGTYVYTVELDGDTSESNDERHVLGSLEIE